MEGFWIDKRLSVTPRNLSLFTPTQLLEVASKKLIDHKCVEIPDEPVEKSSMVKTNRDIEMQCYLSQS